MYIYGTSIIKMTKMADNVGQHINIIVFDSLAWINKKLSTMWFKSLLILWASDK